MKLTALLIPLLTAFTAWFIVWVFFKILFYPVKPIKILGITIQGIFPKNKQLIATRLSDKISKEFSFEMIEEKISDPSNLDKLMPLIDANIDHFLRNKLAEKMPMISMFIGERTINQLKAAFTDELKELFPALMKNYAGSLKDEINIEAIVTEKISSISSQQLETLFNKSFSTQKKKALTAAAFFGLLIGIFQFLLTLIA
jgi:uncharacterized membrane protein YheB (UPF0754 family)